MTVILSLSGCYSSTDDPAGRDAAVADGSRPRDASIELPACDEWCWYEGASIVALDAASASSVWAIDEGGNALHWTGEGWEVEHLGGPLFGLHVHRDETVWVLGDERIWRYDGGAWRVAHERGGRYFAVASERDLWLSSSAGIEHWDGERWTVTLPSTSALDLFVSSAGEAWGGFFGAPDEGTPGTYRFDGTAWTRLGEQSYGKLAELDGEVVRVSGSSVERWDGSAWVDVVLDEAGALEWREPVTLPGVSPRIVVTRGGLVRMSSLRCTSTIRVGDEAFCAESAGRLRHYAGGDRSLSTRESTVPSRDEWGALPPALWAGDAEVAWGTSPDDLLRARGDRESGWVLEHFDGREVRELELPAELAEASLRDVRAVGPGVSLWTASFNDPQRVQVLRYDGEWTVLHERTTELYSIQLGPITAVDDEIWAAGWEQRDGRAGGPGFVLHYDGSQWTRHVLTSTWGIVGLVTDGERFWLSAIPEGEPVQVAPGERGLGSFEVVPVVLENGALWLGSRDLWTTRGVQSMHRSR